jgi:hypothetical protein
MGLSGREAKGSATYSLFLTSSPSLLTFLINDFRAFCY